MDGSTSSTNAPGPEALATGVEPNAASAATSAVVEPAAAEEAAWPVQRSIEAKLASDFAPVEHLSVVNESSGHNVPKGSETHFKVVVVSASFQGMKPLEKHRKVNDALEDHLTNQGVHALSIVAKTPEQWAKSSAVAPSPPCHGGSKR